MLAREEACSLERDLFHTVLVTGRSGHVVGEAGWYRGAGPHLDQGCSAVHISCLAFKPSPLSWGSASVRSLSHCGCVEQSAAFCFLSLLICLIGLAEDEWLNLAC